MSVGYVYCLSNPSMPGLLKIGYTERAMEERLQEANSSGTWGPPTDYVIEIAKFVSEPNHMEQLIHKILEKDRVNPRREFFRVGLEMVKLLFELMEGSSNTKPEPAEKLTGDEVLNLFLNQHVYPPVGSVDVKWETVQDIFMKWKKSNGYTNGAVLNLRKILIDAYGKPEWGGGWNTFAIKLASETSE